MSNKDDKGFFSKEEQDDIMNSLEPKDPQYNGEVVVNDKRVIEKPTEEVEEKSVKKGFLSSLFEKKEEVDCDLLLKQMRDCVNEKKGTTMCKLEVEEWEKHCKENKEEKKEDDEKDE
jgi:hypothetical protein